MRVKGREQAKLGESERCDKAGGNEPVKPGEVMDLAADGAEGV